VASVKIFVRNKTLAGSWGLVLGNKTSKPGPNPVRRWETSFREAAAGCPGWWQQLLPQGHCPGGGGGILQPVGVG